MKKILLALVVLVLVMLASCKCAAEKGAVANVQKTHDKVSAKFLRYVDADPALSAADKKDWHDLVDSDQRNIEALRKSLGD